MKRCLASEIDGTYISSIAFTECPQCFDLAKVASIVKQPETLCILNWSLNIDFLSLKQGNSGQE